MQAEAQLHVGSLAGNNSLERYQCWNNVSVLLGLSLASPSIGPAFYDPAARTLSNEMHELALVAKALALAQQVSTRNCLLRRNCWLII